MQKPTWNTHRYDVERVEQMCKAVAAANALFRRPQPRANRQRRQPLHEPILDADEQRPHNAMDDTHLIPVALPVPAVDPVPEPVIIDALLMPVIIDTSLMPVALPMPTVDPESQIAVNDTHTMPGDPPMPATQAEQQRTTTSAAIESPTLAPFQLAEERLVESPPDVPTATPQVGQLLAPPVEPTMKASMVQTTIDPLETEPLAGPDVAAPYIEYVWTHHQVALKTTQSFFSQLKGG
ncbi:hypothetical protein AC1031_018699 [Aphanomyces cochlioides]|nr:hypothetical protein AC1031_018699 [Aphanomyces cochlioides]